MISGSVVERIEQAISPVSINAAAATSNVTDTLGYRYLVYEVAFGSIGASATVLKVQESDAKTSGTALNGGVDVTGAVVGTSTNDDGAASALPVATTDNNKTWRFEIDLKGRKRYLQVQVTAGAGATLVCALARLGRAEEVPTKAAKKGAKEVLRVPVIS